MSRRNSASALGGIGSPSGVRKPSRRVRAVVGSRSRGEPALPLLLDGADLRAHQAEPLQEAVELGAGVVRQRRPLRRADGLEPVRRLAQAQPQAADAEAGEDRLDAVDEPRLLTTRVSRSRLGRRASSSSFVGIAAMVQWRFSPRSQPRKARINSSVSSRSVLARRCSRDTATLAGWMA